jgi:TonB family protein
MTGKEGQTAKSSSQDNYEATVLDFLDKEMSAVQPSQKPKEYSEELDELVSDLLKQVIHEADQKKPVQNAGDESIEDLLAEFATPEDKSYSGVKTDSASNSDLKPNKTASFPLPAETNVQESSKPAALEMPAKTGAPIPTGSIFAAPAENKRKIPVLALAFVGLLIIVGGAIYFFVNSPGGKSEQIAAQTAAKEPSVLSGKSTASQGASEPAAPQTQAKVIAAPSANRTEAADASTQASVVPAKNPKVAEKTTQQPSVVSTKNTKASEATTRQPAVGNAAMIATPPKVETPAAPVASPPAVSNTNAPSEKQVAPAVSENAKPPEVVAEDKPEQIVPSVSKQEQNAPVVAMNTSSATPEPKPNIPAALKNASPAVPISRANPQYPELAVRTRASATVVLEVAIDSQGKVTTATPVSGPAMFHGEAIKAAMKWRYKPASIEGTNVPSQNRIIFNFNLKK